MGLPFYKIFSLFIRVFSRPVVTYIKTAHLKKESLSSTILHQGFVKLGITYNYMENWVNRKFMNMDSKFANKPLNENIAAEKGVEFFFEMMFYCLMIGVPLYEINRMYTEAEVKDQAIREKLDNTSVYLDSVLKQKNERIERMHELLKKSSKTEIHIENFVKNQNTLEKGSHETSCNKDNISPKS